MLYLQSNHLLKDCALEEIEETLDVNSNEDIQKFRRQTSRGKTEVLSQISSNANVSFTCYIEQIQNIYY